MKYLILIEVDDSSEMARISLNGTMIMEGNFWDFHPGCHLNVTQEYGHFDNYVGLSTKIYQKLIKSGVEYSDIVTQRKKYNYLKTEKNTQQMAASTGISSITQQKIRINKIINTINECDLEVVIYTDGCPARMVNDKRVFIKKTFTLDEIEKEVNHAAKYIRPTLPNKEFETFINSLNENNIRMQKYI